MANVYEKISELQEKLDPESCAFEIGEQLKDICRRDPACEAILLEDLQNPAMDLNAADKMLYDWGKKQAKGKGGYGISGRQAEKLLREFYGLPEQFVDSGAPDRGEESQETENRNREERKVLDLADFL